MAPATTFPFSPLAAICHEVWVHFYDDWWGTGSAKRTSFVYFQSANQPCTSCRRNPKRNIVSLTQPAIALRMQLQIFDPATTEMIDAIARALSEALPTGGRIVDVGAGSGRFAHCLRAALARLGRDHGTVGW